MSEAELASPHCMPRPYAQACCSPRACRLLHSVADLAQWTGMQPMPSRAGLMLARWCAPAYPKRSSLRYRHESSLCPCWRSCSTAWRSYTKLGQCQTSTGSANPPLEREAWQEPTEARYWPPLDSPAPTPSHASCPNHSCVWPMWALAEHMQAVVGTRHTDAAFSNHPPPPPGYTERCWCAAGSYILGSAWRTTEPNIRARPHDHMRTATLMSVDEPRLPALHTLCPTVEVCRLCGGVQGHAQSG